MKICCGTEERSDFSKTLIRLDLLKRGLGKALAIRLICFVRPIKQWLIIPVLENLLSGNENASFLVVLETQYIGPPATR